MAYTLLEDEPQKGYKLIDEPKKGSGSDVYDTVNAVATGFNKALLRTYNPIDVAANIVDLGKAAAGTAYGLTTGNVPPSWLQVTDRSNVPLSADNLIKNSRKTAVTKALVNPMNPDYEGGYSEGFGSGLTAVANPVSKLQALNQGGLGVASNWLGKAVYDATGNDAAAITAGLLPGASQDAVIRATKAVVRGGKDGRQRVAQRIQDLKNAGVDNPTLGLATGSPLVAGFENILSSTPGAVSRMSAANTGAVSGMQAKVASAADLASTNRGSDASGASIQTGAKTFRDDFKARQAALYNNLDKYIPANTPVAVPASRAAFDAANPTIQGAPALSEFFKNSKIEGMRNAFMSDTAGAPASVMVYPQPPKAAGGIMNEPIPQPPLLVTIPAQPATNTLPFQAVKQTRTLVGNEIADTNLASSVPRSKWNPIYGALSEDMKGAANASGPEATAALNRANDFSRAGLARIERVDPIVTKTDAADSYHALERTLRDNTSTFQAVKKSLPEGARGDFAGTVIERLGTATPGQQNAEGSKFSTETFLTNWNKMSDKGKAELLSGFPNSAQVRADIEAVAKAASMMRDNSKVLYNPSGTAAKGAAISYLGLLAGAAGSGNLPLFGSALSLPVAGNLAARAVTSPIVVKSMANRTVVDPQIMGANVRGLLGSGLLQYPDDK